MRLQLAPIAFLPWPLQAGPSMMKTAVLQWPLEEVFASSQPHGPSPEV
jgi:hypothetical protein